MPSVLVTGAGGMLGSIMCDQFAKTGWEVTRLQRTESSETSSAIDTEIILADLNESEQMQSVLKDRRFDVCIHCAAITNLGVCENTPDLAEATHVKATRSLVESNAFDQFVYISTDSVFDGTNGNYVETDSCCPLNVYARTKHEGEAEAQQHPKSMVLRTNLYDLRNPPRTSLAEWAYQSLAKSEQITGFRNVHFNPLNTRQIASIIAQLLSKSYTGMLHLGADQVVSKFDFIQRIAVHFGFDPVLIQPSDYEPNPAAIARPLNTSLSIEKLRGILPDADVSLARGISQLTTKEQPI
jgi:dTDP-4-dehydrorhamnose reductase